MASPSPLLPPVTRAHRPSSRQASGTFMAGIVAGPERNAMARGAALLVRPHHARSGIAGGDDLDVVLALLGPRVGGELAHADAVAPASALADDDVGIVVDRLEEAAVNTGIAGGELGVQGPAHLLGDQGVAVAPGVDDLEPRRAAELVGRCDLEAVGSPDLLNRVPPALAPGLDAPGELLLGQDDRIPLVKPAGAGQIVQRLRRQGLDRGLVERRFDP